MKINILIIIFFTYTVALHSQTNFREGYIITLESDTLHGLIDFKSDYTNAELCRFMKNADSAVEIFNPGSIYGYRYVAEGKFYVSKTVEIDKVKKTFFLEYLLQGLKNLYYLPFNAGYFFFENPDGSLIGITKAPDKIIDQYKLKEDIRYKGVLSYVFRDCLPLSAETSKVSFDKASMIEITREYHERVCDTGEQCIIFEHDYKRSFLKVNYSFSGGFELFHLRLQDAGIQNALSLSPVIGAGVHISSPRVIKSLYLTLEGTLSAMSIAVDYLDVYQNYYKFGYKSLLTSLEAKVEYIYDKGRLRPAIGAGLTNNYMLNPERTYQKNNANFVTGPFIHKSLIGSAASIGFDYHLQKDQFIALRLLYAHHRSVFIESNTVQLKVGYKF